MSQEFPFDLSLLLAPVVEEATATSSASISTDLPSSSRDKRSSDLGKQTPSKKLKSTDSAKPSASAPSTASVRGLPNPSNCCFINAPLQCLDVVLNWEDVASKSKPDGPFPLIHNAMRSRAGSDVLKVAEYVYNTWPQSFDSQYEHQDAHEFLEQILGCIACDYKPLFQTTTSSRITCRRDNLNSLISEYFAEEQISYKCEREGCEGVEAVQKSTILSLPRYLVVEFPRFTIEGVRTVRTTQTIDFEENLSVRYHAAEPPYEYELFGVVNHTGSARSGHYVAIVKRFQQWHYISDSVVNVIQSFAEVQSKSKQNCYLFDLPTGAKMNRVVCTCKSCKGLLSHSRMTVFRHLRDDDAHNSDEEGSSESSDDAASLYSDILTSAASPSSPHSSTASGSSDDSGASVHAPPSDDSSVGVPISDAESERGSESDADTDVAPSTRSALDEPVWSGPADVSLREFLYDVTAFRSHANLSQANVSKLLKLIKHAAPDSAVPSSFRNMEAVVSADLLTLHEADVCVNDCHAYVGQHQDLNECPKCSEPRRNEAGAPRKQFFYFSIVEWIRKLYSVPTIATLLKAHNAENRQANADHKFSDVHQTTLWHQLFEQTFNNDKRSLALALAFDGINVFKRKQHSVWPIVVECLNLPPYLRSTLGFCLVAGIVAGPNKPKSMNAYMDAFLPDLLQLYRGIADVRDSSASASAEASFRLYARLVLVKGDYEGQRIMLFGTGASSRQPCLRCEIKSSYSKLLEKQVIVQARRFLPAASTLRDRGNDVFYGRLDRADARPSETRAAPARRTQASTVLHMRAAAVSIPRASTGGFKDVASICELPYFDHFISMPNDGIHAVASITCRLLKCLRQQQPEDSLKTRNLEKQLRRHPTSWVRNMNNVESAPIPVSNRGRSNLWNLTKTERATADRRRLDVFFPVNVDFNRTLSLYEGFSQDLFSADILQAVKFKLLNYSLRGFLGNAQHKCILDFVDAVTSLLKPATLNERRDLSKDFAEIVVAFEKKFPVSLQVCRLLTILHMHHLLHIVEGIIIFGSFSVIANLSTDRLLKNIKASLHSTHHMEKSIMKAQNMAMAANLASEVNYIPADLRATVEGVRGVAEFEAASQSAAHAAAAGPVDADLANRFPRRNYLDVCKQIAGGDLSGFPKLYGNGRLKCLNDTEAALLRDFYESYFPQLSTEVRETLVALATSVVSYDKCMLIDRDVFRIFQFRTQRSEEHLASRSSFLFQTMTGKVGANKRNLVPGTTDQYFWLGRITDFWNHQFEDSHYEMALVQWRAAPYYSKRDRLWYCCDDEAGTGETLIPVEHAFGHQVAIAFDSSEKRTLDSSSLMESLRENARVHSASNRFYGDLLNASINDDEPVVQAGLERPFDAGINVNVNELAVQNRGGVYVQDTPSPCMRSSSLPSSPIQFAPNPPAGSSCRKLEFRTVNASPNGTAVVSGTHRMEVDPLSSGIAVSVEDCDFVPCSQLSPSLIASSSSNFYNNNNSSIKDFGNAVGKSSASKSTNNNKFTNGGAFSLLDSRNSCVGVPPLEPTAKQCSSSAIAIPAFGSGPEKSRDVGRHGNKDSSGYSSSESPETASPVLVQTGSSNNLASECVNIVSSSSAAHKRQLSADSPDGIERLAGQGRSVECQADDVIDIDDSLDEGHTEAAGNNAIQSIGSSVAPSGRAPSNKNLLQAAMDDSLICLDSDTEAVAQFVSSSHAQAAEPVLLSLLDANDDDDFKPITSSRTNATSSRQRSSVGGPSQGSSRKSNTSGDQTQARPANSRSSNFKRDSQPSQSIAIAKHHQPQPLEKRQGPSASLISAARQPQVVISSQEQAAAGNVAFRSNHGNNGHRSAFGIPEPSRPPWEPWHRRSTPAEQLNNSHTSSSHQKVRADAAWGQSVPAAPQNRRRPFDGPSNQTRKDHSNSVGPTSSSSRRPSTRTTSATTQSTNRTRPACAPIMVIGSSSSTDSDDDFVSTTSRPGGSGVSRPTARRRGNSGAVLVTPQKIKSTARTTPMEGATAQGSSAMVASPERVTVADLFRQRSSAMAPQQKKMKKSQSGSTTAPAAQRNVLPNIINVDSTDEDVITNTRMLDIGAAPRSPPDGPSATLRASRAERPEEAEVEQISSSDATSDNSNDAVWATASSGSPDLLESPGTGSDSNNEAAGNAMDFQGAVGLSPAVQQDLERARQLEEDEEMARQLQAQFDAEASRRTAHRIAAFREQPVFMVEEDGLREASPTFLSSTTPPRRRFFPAVSTTTVPRPGSTRRAAASGRNNPPRSGEIVDLASVDPETFSDGVEEMDEQEEMRLAEIAAARRQQRMHGMRFRTGREGATEPAGGGSRPALGSRAFRPPARMGQYEDDEEDTWQAVRVVNGEEVVEPIRRPIPTAPQANDAAVASATSTASAFASAGVANVFEQFRPPARVVSSSGPAATNATTTTAPTAMPANLFDRFTLMVRDLADETPADQRGAVVHPVPQRTTTHVHPTSVAGGATLGAAVAAAREFRFRQPTRGSGGATLGDAASREEARLQAAVDQFYNPDEEDYHFSPPRRVHRTRGATATANATNEPPTTASGAANASVAPRLSNLHVRLQPLRFQTSSDSAQGGDVHTDDHEHTIPRVRWQVSDRPLHPADRYAPAAGRNTRAAERRPVFMEVAPHGGGTVAARRARPFGVDAPVQMHFLAPYVNLRQLGGRANGNGVDYEELLDLAEFLGDATPRLSSMQIRRLPVCKYHRAAAPSTSAAVASSSKSESTFDDATCRICLCDYDDGDEQRVLPCFHRFHVACVDQWLTRKVSCPICRIDVRKVEPD